MIHEFPSTIEYRAGYKCMYVLRVLRYREKKTESWKFCGGGRDEGF